MFFFIAKYLRLLMVLLQPLLLHRVYLPIARDLRLLQNGAAPPTEVYLPIDRDLRLLHNGAVPMEVGIYPW